jgi:hypothetical protein
VARRSRCWTPGRLSRSSTDGPLLLYEYWWTIANFDSPNTSGGWSGAEHKEGHRIARIPHTTAEPSEETDRRGFAGYTAQIKLFFPTEQGWRIRDRVAGVRYLTPLPVDLEEKLDKDWQDLSPILEGASAVAGAASSFAGPAATETAIVIPAALQGDSGTPREGCLRAYAALHRDGEATPMTFTPELPVLLRVEPQ